jgi:hypothetical protein
VYRPGGDVQKRTAVREIEQRSGTLTASSARIVARLCAKFGAQIAFEDDGS